MKNIIRLLVLSIIVGMVLWLAGCSDETNSPVASTTTISTPATEIITIHPKGTISGVIYDRCTNMAINGAVMSVSHDGINYSAISDAAGSFSFANVPAGAYTIIDGSSVPTGIYTITASLVAYNASQTDATKRYKNFYYYPVTITFTSLVPGDSLGVSGLVGTVACSLATLSTTVRGTVVDQALQPVADANVIIYDHFATPYGVVGRAVTGADGSFIVGSIENGIAIDVKAMSADGSTEGSRLNFSIPCNLGADSLRAQVSTEQIVLAPVDDVAPYVTSITPENNADVNPAGLHIVFNFSEPIKQNAYTQTNLGLGSGTIVDDITITYSGFKKSAANLPIPTFAWTSSSQLTITPSGLIGSAKYVVNATVAMPKLRDLANRAVVNNAAITGDFEALNFSTAGASTKPTAPVLTRQIIPAVYTTLNYTGGTVSLEWNYNANARGYNIYRSINGGSFDILASNIQFTQYQTVCPALYAGSLNNPIGTANVKYKVTGVSKDLVEGDTSNAIIVTDEVKPQFTYFPAPAAVAGITNSWVYAIGFNEPMSQATVENIVNYTFSNVGGVTYTISSINYVGWDGVRYRAYLQVTSSIAPVPGYILTTAATITDLAGNGIDPAANSHTY